VRTKIDVGNREQGNRDSFQSTCAWLHLLSELIVIELAADEFPLGGQTPLSGRLDALLGQLAARERLGRVVHVRHHLTHQPAR